MAVTWPAKNNYATGDVLTAANMNGIGDDLNDLYNNYRGAPLVAGKNFVINGGFDIWQRGTSFSKDVYNADRWYCQNSAGTTTISQESTIVATGSRYSLKTAQTVATGTVYVLQAIETANVIPLAGQTVTLSFQAYASTSTSISFSVGYSTSVDNSVTGSYTGITASSGGSPTTVSTSWTKLTGTYAIPSTAKTLQILIQYQIASGVSVYLDQVQLEVGSSATSFSRAGATFGGELALCQRYYHRISSSEGDAYSYYGVGFIYSTNQPTFYTPHPSKMRTTPALTASSTAGDFQLLITNTTATVTSVPTLQAGNQNGSAWSVGASGLTAGQACMLRTNNTASTWIAFSAEL